MDVYVLAAERSAETAARFADRWLEGLELFAEEIEVPQYAQEPEALFETPEEAIGWLLDRPEEPHALYWRNPEEGEVAYAMLFFTVDGGLIAGLTVQEEGPALADWLQRLVSTVGGTDGYVAFESPPPDSAAEFRRNAAAADPPRLVGGRLVA